MRRRQERHASARWRPGPGEFAGIHDIQRYVIEELANPNYFWTQCSTVLLQPEVRDYHAHASFGYSWLKDVWLAP